MTNIELAMKLNSRETLVRKVNELKAELDKIETSIKEEMLGRAAEELLVEGFKVSYKEVISNRFDSSSFKQDLGEQLYNKYCRPSSCMRFTVK